MRVPSLKAIADTVLIVCALVVTTIAGQLYLQNRPVEPRIVAANERISLPGVDFKQSQRTLLLVLSSKCPFCEKSMPFYSQMLAKKGKQSRVVVVGGEDQKLLQTYLSLHEITVDNVTQVTGQNTPSQVTPTAILVDSGGVVTKVWRGQLSPQAEDEVIQIMSQE